MNKEKRIEQIKDRLYYLDMITFQTEEQKNLVNELNKELIELEKGID